MFGVTYKKLLVLCIYIYGDYNLCYSLIEEINPTSSAIWVVLIFKPVFMCYSSFFK